MSVAQNVAQLLVTTDLKAFVTLQSLKSSLKVNHFSTVSELSEFLSNPSFDVEYDIVDLIYVPILDEDESLTFKTYSKTTFLRDYPYEPSTS